MDKTIGFIGGGNMASAMIGGILSAGLVTPRQIIVSDALETVRKRLEEDHAVRVTADNREVTIQADVLILAVKPQVQETVIREIRDAVNDNTLVVSIAAGRSIAEIERTFDREIRLVRVMPNTAALVSEAMSALCGNTNLRDGDLGLVKTIFNSFGKAEIITEHLMDAVVGVSGSAPAYVFMFIEAMADAAVAEGMPRAQAYTFAAQAVAGSAQLMLKTGLHPGELKDQVCSPAGTTIAAVRVLEEQGFRGTVMDAVIAASEKSREMGAKK